jgi:tetratricopeptide (TPR) repeat protein
MGKACKWIFFLLPACNCGAQIPAAAWPFRTATDLREEKISAARLRHKFISKAVAAFSRALKLAQSGAWEIGARELEKAVAIDPGFSEAHGNLGVYYFKLGYLEQAARELRRAIELDPATSLDHSNLAVIMLLLQRPAEAEAEAETAVGLDGANFRAHYVLGLLLTRREETREEGKEHLFYAARELPTAYLELAQLFRAEGDDQHATLELDRYKLAIAAQPKK